MTTPVNFCSKILLFGEYGIIKNSMGLCMPFPLFEGHLTFPSEGNPQTHGKDSNVELKSLLMYLKDLNGSLGASFDLDSFEFDLGQGLFFDSTIPQGFGLGSSGAVSAAVFDRYVIGKQEWREDLSKILDLKEVLSKIEGHFHGKSSGLDPLVSFLGRPVVIEFNGKITLADLPKDSKGEGAIFLLNTGRPRRTEPLVNLFLEKCKQADFNELCLTELKNINDCLVKAFLKKDAPMLTENFERLSQFQYEHMAPMIPKLYQKPWREGLESKDFFFKLCGAGGGGFILGLTKDFKRAKKRLQGQQLRAVHTF